MTTLQNSDLVLQAAHAPLVAAVLKQRLIATGQALICCAVRDQASFFTMEILSHTAIIVICSTIYGTHGVMFEIWLRMQDPTLDFTLPTYICHCFVSAILDVVTFVCISRQLLCCAGHI